MSLINVLGEKQAVSPSTGQPLKSHAGLLLPGDPEFSNAMQKGSIVIGGEEVAMTLQCCHCGGHWIPIRGSGRQRGFCTNCMAPHCGRRECWPCVPAEKKLEKIEKEYNEKVKYEIRDITVKP